jgi:transposase
MIRIIYFMFTRRQAYRDSGMDYQALVVNRNAPRWIQALKKYGYWPTPKVAEMSIPVPAP